MNVIPAFFFGLLLSKVKHFLIASIALIFINGYQDQLMCIDVIASQTPTRCRRNNVLI